MTVFSLKIVASDKIFFEGKCIMLVIPGIDGKMGIMAHHQNMISALDTGEISFTTEDGISKRAVIGRGLVQMMNNRAVVFVETAESPEEIDRKRAEEAKERALEQLRQKQSIREHYHTQASLARAMSRLRVSAGSDLKISNR